MVPVLEVRDLTVKYASCVLHSISFELMEGETVGLLGESGSGKTTLGLSLLGLLPPGGAFVSGSIRFRNRELLTLPDGELRSLRGSEIAMIFQEADNALNPFQRAEKQVEDVICAHRSWPRSHCRNEARKVLETMRLGSDLLSAYPHQLSGGERQRLVIAQALACRPAVLVADEPLASLDSISQGAWLDSIKDLRERQQLTVLLITHDPTVLAGVADRIVILYSGRIVESGAFEQVTQCPLHPYTQALLRAIPPNVATNARGTKRLPTFAPGVMESVGDGQGCSFQHCCPDRMQRCSHEQPPEVSARGQRVRCFKYVD